MTHNQALFVKADGGPMYFSMVPCSERKEIRELIENGGGVLLQPGKNPYAVRLVPTCIATTEGPDDAFSATYIRACCSSNKLFPLKEFKIPRAPAAETVDDGDCKKRELRSVRSRREYSLGEQIAIAKYIANKSRVSVRGNEVYKEMAAASVVPGAHSWQSLKQHYLTKILPWKHLYESPDASKLLAKRHAREAQETRDASPSASSECGSVIVEDSSSDDEPKPRGTTGVGVEDKWGTETEVVAETESQGASSCSSDRDTTAVRQRSSGRGKMKRRKLVLSTTYFSSSHKGSSSESPPRHKINIPAPGKNSHDDSIAAASENTDKVLPEKSAMPTSPRVQSKMFPGKTCSIQTQPEPGKRNDGVQRADSKTAAVLETTSSKKQVLRSPRRKSKNAKQQETPADYTSVHSEYESTGVHSLPHSDLSEGLCVSDCVDMQQTTQSSPQKKVGTATSQKHTSGRLSPSLLSQSRDCTASGVAEEQMSLASKLRSFRLPTRKRGSAESQANLGTSLNAQSTFQSTYYDAATADKSPGIEASSGKRPSRSSRSKQQNTTRQSDADGHLHEPAHSESTDGIATTKALLPSPESAYNTAESEGTPNGRKRVGKDGKKVLSAPRLQAEPDSTAMKTRRKALRMPALHRSDKTSPPSSENKRWSSPQAAGCKKVRASKRGIADRTSGFDNADDALLARIAEQASALRVSAERSSEEQDDATTITLSSSDSDSASDGEVEKVQRELLRLLGALREAKSRPPHTTCPPQCTCPLTTWYAQSTRAAVSLSAFLAVHDAPLPDQQGGVTDPVVAMALERLLRHLEQGANEDDGLR